MESQNEGHELNEVQVSPSFARTPREGARIPSSDISTVTLCPTPEMNRKMKEHSPRKADKNFIPHLFEMTSFKSMKSTVNSDKSYDVSQRLHSLEQKLETFETTVNRSTRVILDVLLKQTIQCQESVASPLGKSGKNNAHDPVDTLDVCGISSNLPQCSDFQNAPCYIMKETTT
ncbi:uncharacterized protein LOC144346434 [Saccoglossus kowalevskii]